MDDTLMSKAFDLRYHWSDILSLSWKLEVHRKKWRALDPDLAGLIILFVPIFPSAWQQSRRKLRMIRWNAAPWESSLRLATRKCLVVFCLCAWQSARLFWAHVQGGSVCCREHRADSLLCFLVRMKFHDIWWMHPARPFQKRVFQGCSSPGTCLSPRLPFCGRAALSLGGTEAAGSRRPAWRLRFLFGELLAWIQFLLVGPVLNLVAAAVMLESGAGS